jgi:hypothetical protein
MKNSNDTIGNRTRDLPACRAVPDLSINLITKPLMANCTVQWSLRPRPLYTVYILILAAFHDISPTADMAVMRFGYDLHAKPQGMAETIPLR